MQIPDLCLQPMENKRSRLERGFSQGVGWGLRLRRCVYTCKKLVEARAYLRHSVDHLGTILYTRGQQLVDRLLSKTQYLAVQVLPESRWYFLAVLLMGHHAVMQITESTLRRHREASVV